MRYGICIAGKQQRKVLDVMSVRKRFKYLRPHSAASQQTPKEDMPVDVKQGCLFGPEPQPSGQRIPAAAKRSPKQDLPADPAGPGRRPCGLRTGAAAERTPKQDLPADSREGCPTRPQPQASGQETICKQDILPSGSNAFAATRQIRVCADSVCSLQVLSLYQLPDQSAH